jgi:putative ABC transport system permease protein
MLRQDLGYAWRVLRERPLVTATIVLTLALGIGANTAVFSLLNAVVLRSPLPVPESDELYAVNGGPYAATASERARMSGPMFEAMLQAAPAGVGVVAMSRAVARVYTRRDGEREATPANLHLVSPGFFRVVGVRPGLGRGLPEDPEGAHEAVAVLSDACWQRRFGGSPDVVGSRLSINGTAFTIVGVGPRGFSGVWLESPVDVWVPLAMQPAVRYSQSFSADGADLAKPWLPQARIWWLHVVVRVPRGQVAAAASAFGSSLSSLAGRDYRVSLAPFGRGFSQLRQRFFAPLLALMAMAALVLLAACANVANLLLARAVSRRRELAVRMALGAGRGRLLRQLLTESVLLVGMSGVAAVLLAGWAGSLLARVATSTADGPPPLAAHLDIRVLSFTAGVAFLSVLAFGVWRAYRATRVDVASALQSGVRGAIGAGARPTRALVVLQVALSLVLVSATLLFARAFRKLQDLDLGLARERLLTVGIDPRLSGVPPEELPATYARVLEAVARVPGVDRAALAMCGLRGGCATEDGFHVEGYESRANEPVAFSVNVVTPGYFETVGMRVLAGRGLGEFDLEHSPKVAVANRTLARTCFGDWRRAVGRRFGLGTPDVEIVGVVEDARALGNVKAPPPPSVFLPLAQRAVVPRALEVRTSVEPAATAAAVRSALGVAAPGLPVESLETVESLVRRGLGQERLVVRLTSAFGALALGLAGLGLFGVLSHAVARRTPEFGLRMALGASRSQVLRSVVQDGLRIVALGLLLGLPCALVAGAAVSAFFLGVSPYDVGSVVAAVLVLLGVGAACGLAPALRAARVDPVVALRED